MGLQKTKQIGDTVRVPQICDARTNGEHRTALDGGSTKNVFPFYYLNDTRGLFYIRQISKTTEIENIFHTTNLGRVL